MPCFKEGIQILELASSGKVELCISESSVMNLIYLANDIYKINGALEKLVDMLGACHVVSGGKDRILEALKSSFKDKEDAVQYYTALNSDSPYFITRNVKDYKYSSASLRVLTPKEFLSIIRK